MGLWIFEVLRQSDMNSAVMLSHLPPKVLEKERKDTKEFTNTRLKTTDTAILYKYNALLALLKSKDVTPLHRTFCSNTAPPYCALDIK